MGGVKSYFSNVIGSPVGHLTLIASDAGLAGVLWGNENPRRYRLENVTERKEHPVLAQAERELSEYFAGERQAFAVPLDPVGTKFQRRVWDALLAIPYGETRSYGRLAQEIGCLAAARAVGAANGRNPISIIVPCHRVLGSDGSLTGFGGGLSAKARLLALERQGPGVPSRVPNRAPDARASEPAHT